MNVVFCGAPGAVGVYRAVLPARALAQLGHKALVLGGAEGSFSPEDQARLIRSADVVVILHPGGWFADRHEAFKAMRGALVVELDDDVWSWHVDPASREPFVAELAAAHGIAPLSLEQIAQLEEWVRAADLCTTTTEPLAAVLRSKGAREVAVCPNALAIDWKRATPRRGSLAATSVLARATKRHAAIATPATRRIGWTGSIHHKADLRGAPLAAVERVASLAPEVELFVLGPVNPATLVEGRLHVPTTRFGMFRGKTKDKAGNVVHENAVRFGGIPAYAEEIYERAFTGGVPFEGYFQTLELLDVDVAILPMRESSLNASKSDVTLLAWALKGVPVVCSKTGPYARAFEAGFPAIYVPHDDENAWTEALRGLLYDRTAAKELGHRAQAWTLERRCFPGPERAWLEALERAVDLHDARAEAGAA